MSSDAQWLRSFEEAFENALSGILPISDRLQGHLEHDPIPGSSTMYWLRVNVPAYRFYRPVSLRYPTGTMRIVGKTMHAQVFISTQVNPNGVTGPDDIQRTWTIDFSVCADIIPFKCRTVREDSTLIKYYKYHTDMLESVLAFKRWLGGDDGVNAAEHDAKEFFHYIQPVTPQFWEVKEKAHA